MTALSAFLAPIPGALTTPCPEGQDGDVETGLWGFGAASALGVAAFVAFAIWAARGPRRRALKVLAGAAVLLSLLALGVVFLATRVLTCVPV